MSIDKPFRALAAAAVFCLSVTLPAAAQPAYPASASSEVWSLNIGDQLAQSLASPVEAIKEQALNQTMYYAQFHGTALDLTAAVPALVAIYENDGADESRVAAVAALYAIGDEAALQRVRATLRHQTSLQVRIAAFGALMAFYGPETFAGDDELAAMAEETSALLAAQREVSVPPTMATGD